MFELIGSKLKKLYNLERKRLHKKGFLNVMIGSVLLWCIIYFSVTIGAYVWPQVIQDKIQFVIIISFIIHFTCQILYFLIYLPGYLKLMPIFEKYKINPAISKPWERDNWSETRAKTIKYVVINYCLVYPLTVLISMKLNKTKLRFDDFPSAWELFIQLYVIYFIQDFFFYFAHRISHQNKFMYTFHKIHHEYDSLYTLVTEYTHPIDYFVGNLFPSAMAFIILGSNCHCFTFFFWQAWKMFTSTQGHSGYEFPWSPTRVFFFVSGSSFHDYHHSKNDGNYAGSSYIWDTFLSTSSQVYLQSYFKEIK